MDKSNNFENIKNRFNSAKSNIIIVAPFIKLNTLKKLLNEISPNVSISIYTRWNPNEIKSGVTDIECYKFASSIKAKFYLIENLHAKYYRADETVFTGSANITNSGLGISMNPNLEFIEESAFSKIHSEFQSKLSEAILVDDQLYEDMKILVSLIQDEIYLDQDKQWVPNTSMPNKLYSYYNENINKQSDYDEDMFNDLKFLSIPPNLQEQDFNNFVKTKIRVSYLFNKLDKKITHEHRFGEISQFIKTSVFTEVESSEAKKIWKSAMNWLLYFIPESFDYKRPRISEIIMRKKT